MLEKRVWIPMKSGKSRDKRRKRMKLLISPR
jgi:hypothetical protein